MKRECIAAEVSVEIEPKIELEEISTPLVGLKFSIEFRPQVCTFETCPPILRMSVYRSRLEVAVVRPSRRE